MNTVTTTATYTKGVLVPAIKPPYGTEEVLVVYLPKKVASPTRKKTASIKKFKEAMNATFGIWKDKDIPDGVTYVNTLRNEAEQHLTKIWRGIQK